MPADKRVLLIDMRAAERGRLAASINKLGYVATPAEDITAAQALWNREAYPAVIVDLRDQHAQISELRAHMPGSTLIALGARTLAGAMAAWHAGADDYLPWPVRQNELANTLERMLDIRAAKLAEAQPERSALAEFHRLAAELAHQINAPLTPILGMADLLAEELPPNHPGQAYAQAITAAAIRIRDVAWMLADMAQQSG
jgi:DNA-binding NtrC family response regulator